MSDLHPGESIQLFYNAESALPTSLAIRNEAGAHHQLALDQGTRSTLANEPEVVYTVNVLSTLPALGEDVVTALSSANRFSFDVRFWGAMLLATAGGAIPIALLLLWFRLYRRPRPADESALE